MSAVLERDAVRSVRKTNKLIYILAPSYSGSTLLTFLLAQHPEISTIGELKAPETNRDGNYLCSCGEKIVDCTFWNELTVHCESNGMNFNVADFATQIRGSTRFRNRLLTAQYRGKSLEALRALAIRIVPGVTKELSDFIRRNYELSQAICRIQRGPVFLDGSKTAMRLKHFIDSGLWDLRVVHLSRDGRGVVRSNMSHIGLDYSAAADRWKNAAEEILRVRDLVPEQNRIDVKYEELCRNPEVQLKRILQLADLEDFAFNGNRYEKKNCHIVGNKMRLRDTSEIRLDEKWRSESTDAELGEFETIASVVNQRLGYT